MGSITLRFVSSNDLTSRIIRGAEMGFLYQHVEALMPDGSLLGAHIDGGVQSRDRNYDAGQYVQDLIVAIPCSDEQQEAFEAFLKAQIGKPYDLSALMEMADGFITGEAPNWEHSAEWICSALITGAALQSTVSGNPGIFRGAPATVRLATPRDVLCMVAALVPLPSPNLAG